MLRQIEPDISTCHGNEQQKARLEMELPLLTNASRPYQATARAASSTWRAGTTSSSMARPQTGRHHVCTAPASPETFEFETPSGCWGLVVSVVSLLGLDGREVVAVLEGTAVVEPVDPLGGGDLEVVEALPRPLRLDQLGLVEPDHRLGQGVVIRRPDGSGRGFDPQRWPGARSRPRTGTDAVIVMRDQAGQVPALAMRVQIACSTASTTSWLVIVVATDQPRIRRRRRR